MLDTDALEVALSPCPNDVFMVGAWMLGWVTTQPLPFCRFVFADIEELNQRVLAGKAQVSKASAAIYPLVADMYEMLEAGIAASKRWGPLLVVKKNTPKTTLQRIAVPGIHTTATLLLRAYLHPHQPELLPVNFREVAHLVLNGTVDAGVLIHEMRFCYQHYGLKKVADLGRWWVKETGLPVPLGIFLIKRELAPLAPLVSTALKNSIKFAQKHYHHMLPLVKKFAQQLDNKTLSLHIRAYVNRYTTNQLLIKQALEPLARWTRSGRESNPQPRDP